MVTCYACGEVSPPLHGHYNSTEHRRRSRGVLTPAQRSALAAYAETQSYAESGVRLRKSPATVGRHIRDAYLRLGADGHLDALRRLGWLRVPEDAT